MASKRFSPMDAEEMDKKSLLPNKNKETVRSNIKCARTLKAYLEEIGQDSKFEEFDKGRLNDVLSSFYFRARKQDGELYKATTLENMRQALNRYLQSEPFNRDINIIWDSEFKDANEAFKVAMARLKQLGKGKIVHHKIINQSDRAKLYLSKFMDISTPHGLLNKVQFDIRLYFSTLCSVENMHQMTKETFEVLRDPRTGLRYITKSGTNSSDAMPQFPGSQFCPVVSYEKYIRKLHPLCPGLWQRAKELYLESDEIWYHNSRLGQKCLSTFMSKLSVDVELSQLYSNYSITTTGAKILTQNVLDLSQINTITGLTPLQPLTLVFNMDTEKKTMIGHVGAQSGNKPSHNDAVLPRMSTKAIPGTCTSTIALRSMTETDKSLQAMVLSLETNDIGRTVNLPGASKPVSDSSSNISNKTTMSSDIQTKSNGVAMAHVSLDVSTPGDIDRMEDSDNAEHDGIDFKSLEDELYDQEISNILTDAPENKQIRVDKDVMKNRCHDIGTLNTPEMELDSNISGNSGLLGEREECRDDEIVLKDTSTNISKRKLDVDKAKHVSATNDVGIKMDENEDNLVSSEETDIVFRRKLDTENALCESASHSVHSNSNDTIIEKATPLFEVNSESNEENGKGTCIRESVSDDEDRAEDVEDTSMKYDDDTGIVASPSNAISDSEQREPETENCMDKRESEKEDNDCTFLKISHVVSHACEDDIMKDSQYDLETINENCSDNENVQGSEERDTSDEDMDDEMDCMDTLNNSKHEVQPKILVKNVFSLSEGKLHTDDLTNTENTQEQVSGEHSVSLNETSPGFVLVGNNLESGLESNNACSPALQNESLTDQHANDSMTGIDPTNEEMVGADSDTSYLNVKIKEEPPDYNEYDQSINIDHGSHADNFGYLGEDQHREDSDKFYDEDRGFDLPHDIEYDHTLMEDRDSVTGDEYVERTPDGLFKCRYCSCEIADFHQFFKHVQTFHNKQYEHTSMEDRGSTSVTEDESVECTPDGMFKCKYCSCKIADYDRFLKHVQSLHKKQYACKHCGEKFLKSQALAIHVRMKHNVEVSVKNCVKKVIKSDPKKDKVYYVTNKNNKTQIIEKCGSRRLSNSKVLTGSGESMYKCAYCPSLFEKQQTMACHVRNVHIVPKCQKKLKTKYRKYVGSLGKHPSRIGDSPLKREKRPLPNVLQKSKGRLTKASKAAEDESEKIAQLQEDYNIHIEPKIFRCNHCPKWFFKKNEFSNHMLKHERNNFEDIKKEIPSDEDKQLDGEDTSFVSFCKYCPSKFESIKKLTIHLVKHLGEIHKANGEISKELTCSICEHKEMNLATMKKHLKSHLKSEVEKMDPYGLSECSYCGQPFLSAELLLKHENMHRRYKISKQILKESRKKQLMKASGNITFKRPSLESIDIKDVKMPKAEKIKEQMNSFTTSSESNGTESVTVGVQSSPNAKTMRNDAGKCTGKQIRDVDVMLSEIPFQCGMCKSRFPSSQYLLHHMTLHMKGKYVFRIEQDKQDVTSEPDEPVSLQPKHSVPQSIIIPKLTSVPLSKSLSPQKAHIVPLVPKPFSLLNPNYSEPAKPKYVLRPLLPPKSQAGGVIGTSPPKLKTILFQPLKSSQTITSTSAFIPTSSPKKMSSQTAKNIVFSATDEKKNVQVFNFVSQPMIKNTKPPNASTNSTQVLSKAIMSVPDITGSKQYVSLIKEGRRVLAVKTTDKSSIKGGENPCQVSMTNTPPSLLPPASAQILISHPDKKGKTNFSSPKSAKSLLKNGVFEKLKEKLGKTTKSKDIEKALPSIESDEDILNSSSSDSVNEEDLDSSSNDEDESKLDSAEEQSQDPDYGISQSSRHSRKRKLKDKQGVTKKRKIDDKTMVSISHKKDRLTAYKKKISFLEGSWFECSLCMFQTNHRKDYEQHLLTHKNVKKKDLVTCHVCKRQFISKWHLEKHRNQHKESKYQCSFCSLGFGTSAQVVEHISSVHA